jgi:hypothetical protein
MNRILRSLLREPTERRLTDLEKAWGEYTARGIAEYESSRHAHSHAIARLAQEAQR